MSQRDVERFVTDVKSSKKLQDELKSKGASGASALIEVGKGNGYDISADDVKAYLRANKPELKEEELEAVAGGRGRIPMIVGPIIIIILPF